MILYSRGNKLAMWTLIRGDEENILDGGNSGTDVEVEGALGGVPSFQSTWKQACYCRVGFQGECIQLWTRILY